MTCWMLKPYTFTKLLRRLTRMFRFSQNWCTVQMLNSSWTIILHKISITSAHSMQLVRYTSPHSLIRLPANPTLTLTLLLSFNRSSRVHLKKMMNSSEIWWWLIQTWHRVTYGKFLSQKIVSENHLIISSWIYWRRSWSVFHCIDWKVPRITNILTCIPILHQVLP